MKRAALAVALALSIALPAGLASANIARPAAHPRVQVGGTSTSRNVGNSKASVKTRRSRAGERAPKGKVNNASKTKKPTSGGSVGAGNPSVGGTRVRTRQRASGHSRMIVRGDARGTPIRTVLGL
jgi:hypothetical protein